MPKVYNKREKNIPPGAVYIGRPSAWGNPFTHIPKGTQAQFVVKNRDEAVDQYRLWLLAQPDLVAKVQRDLRGKDLVCWCSPQRCHGHVLVEIANAPESNPVVQASQEPEGEFHHAPKQLPRRPTW